MHVIVRWRSGPISISRTVFISFMNWKHMRIGYPQDICQQKDAIFLVHIFLMLLQQKDLENMVLILSCTMSRLLQPLLVHLSTAVNQNQVYYPCRSSCVMILVCWDSYHCKNTKARIVNRAKPENENVNHEHCYSMYTLDSTTIVRPWNVESTRWVAIIVPRIRVSHKTETTSRKSPSWSYLMRGAMD